eukprot:1196149-Prorocentrum_minimum.AAC.4
MPTSRSKCKPPFSPPVISPGTLPPLPRLIPALEVRSLSSRVWIPPFRSSLPCRDQPIRSRSQCSRSSLPYLFPAKASTLDRYFPYLFPTNAARNR